MSRTLLKPACSWIFSAGTKNTFAHWYTFKQQALCLNFTFKNSFKIFLLNYIILKNQVFWEVLLCHLISSWLCLKDCNACFFKFGSQRRLLDCKDEETMGPFKCQELLKQEQNVTSQRTSVFRSTAVRTSNVTLLVFLLWLYYMQNKCPKMHSSIFRSKICHPIRASH